METLTIIYYTSNMENPKFERKIQENILKNCGGLQIISVSRKPIDFGSNICIGEQPVCYSNLWKQQLIGLKEAKTEFCITAEADCLYPPEYFTFTPLVKNRVYRYSPVWAYWENRRKFWEKPRCEGAQMCGREYWIERLETVLGGHKGWEPMDNPREMVVKIFDKRKEGTWTGNPVVTFKTKHNISNKTSLTKTPSVTTLPYWGDGVKLHERMFG